jgi:hypothetical protein
MPRLAGYAGAPLSLSPAETICAHRRIFPEH